MQGRLSSGYHSLFWRVLVFVSLAVVCVGMGVAMGRTMPETPQLAYQSNRGRGWDIYVVDVRRHLDVRMTFERAFDYAPAWSPDGTQIAFSSGRSGFYDLYLIDLNRRQTYAITSGLSPDTRPRWLDQTTIQYEVIGEIESGNNLYHLDLMSGQRQFMGSIAPWSAPGIASPDSARVASVKAERGNFDIAVLDVARTRESRIAAHPANEHQPAWSSDSQWLAFASDRDGGWEIYIASLDGAHVERVTYNLAHDTMPSWRPGRSTSGSGLASAVLLPCRC